MRKIIYYSIIALAALTFNSCEDFLTPDSDDILLERDYVGQYGELYSGYMGLAAAMQQVADQASFLEGLRGDLLEPTVNASREIWDIYNYENLSGNSFADPKGYYNIIQNANDFLEHLFEYRKKNPTVLDAATYNGIIGGAIRYKVWAYLMLAKIYGEAIYFDEPVTAYVDLSKYPVLQFDEIIQKCRDLMETGVNGVNGLGDVKWSTALFPNQGASPTTLMWDRICPPSECLLAEIYLYQNEYAKTIQQCVSIIKRGGEQEQSYQLNLSEYNGEWKQFGYNFVRKEQITVAFFDYSLKQTNRLIEYYSNNYPNKYYLRPTEANMNRFNSQVNAGGIVNDQYRGTGVTFKRVNNEWVLQKFLAGHESSDKIYANDVQISFYRAAEVHLFLIEALVGLGRFEEAFAFLNNGIGSYYNQTIAKFNAPFQDYPATLFRTTTTSEGANRGVRGRVNLGPVGEFALSSASALDTLINIQRMDSLIVEEISLELAGEGKALYAMNRMARRWSAGADKSWAAQWMNSENMNEALQLWGSKVQSDWAAKIGAKFQNGKGNAVTDELQSDLSKWFIKFDLKQ